MVQVYKERENTNRKEKGGGWVGDKEDITAWPRRMRLQAQQKRCCRDDQYELFSFFLFSLLSITLLHNL